MLKFNQPFTTYDVARTLKDESGTFLVQRAGQTAVVQAREGHSIASWTPVGSIEPSAVAPGSNPPYTVTRIDESGSMDRERERGQRND